MLSQDPAGWEELCQFAPVGSLGYVLQNLQATWKTKILLWRWQGHPNPWSWGYTYWSRILTSSLQCQRTQMQAPLALAVSMGISRTELLSIAQCCQALVCTGANSPGWYGDQFSNLSPTLFEDEVKTPSSALFSIVISCSMQVRATQDDALPIRLKIRNRSVCFFSVFWREGPRVLAEGRWLTAENQSSKKCPATFWVDLYSSQHSLLAGLYPPLHMPAPKDPAPMYSALSRNYVGVQLSAEQPQATILPHCVTLELLGKKTHFTAEIGSGWS